MFCDHSDFYRRLVWDCCEELEMTGRPAGSVSGRLSMTDHPRLDVSDELYAIQRWPQCHAERNCFNLTGSIIWKIRSLSVHENSSNGMVVTREKQQKYQVSYFY